MAVLTRFHLVRHGEVLNPRHIVYGALPGYGLSARGEQQARQAGEQLSARPLTAVWSSPLERAVRTAEELAAPHRLPVMVDENLAEWRLADGWAGVVWENLPSERPSELEAYLAHPTDLPFASESLAELANRLEAAVRRLVDRYGGSEFALVSHQDPIQAVRLRLLGVPLERLPEGKPVHGQVLSFEADSGYRLTGTWQPPDTEPFPPRA